MALKNLNQVWGNRMAEQNSHLVEQIFFFESNFFETNFRSPTERKKSTSKNNHWHTERKKKMSFVFVKNKNFYRKKNKIPKRKRFVFVGSPACIARPWHHATK